MQTDEVQHDGLWITLKRILHRSRRAQILMMMLADAMVVVVSAALGYLVRFEGEIPPDFSTHILPATLAAIVVFIGCLWFSRLYHVVLRYVGIEVMTRLSGAVLSAFTILFVADGVIGTLHGERLVPFGVILITCTFAFVGLAGLRSVGRLWVVMTGAGSKGDHRVLIIGAGDAGSLLLRDIENQPQLGYNVVGFLDDAPEKHRLMVRGTKILGGIEDLPEIISRETRDLLICVRSRSKTYWAGSPMRSISRSSRRR